MSIRPTGRTRDPGWRGWLADRRTVTAIVYGLYAACVALLVAELFVDRHVDFDVQGWFGFYAGFGFFAYCGIVALARVLRRLVRRPEDYYLPADDRDPPERDRDLPERDGDLPERDGDLPEEDGDLPEKDRDLPEEDRGGDGRDG